jgi:hypothetical protein
MMMAAIRKPTSIECRRIPSLSKHFQAMPRDVTFLKDRDKRGEHELVGRKRRSF